MTDVVSVCVPPPLAVAEIVMPYVSLGRSVGSKVASVAGGAPVPLASVTGSDGSRSWYDTLHDVMVWPAGGVIVPLMGTGLVTVAPSAGDGAVIDGGGGPGEPGAGPGGVVQETTVTFETVRAPAIVAVACTLSVPLLIPTYDRLTRPLASVVPLTWPPFGPNTESVTGRFGIGRPVESIGAAVKVSV